MILQLLPLHSRPSGQAEVRETEGILFMRCVRFENEYSLSSCLVAAMEINSNTCSLRWLSSSELTETQLTFLLAYKWKFSRGTSTAGQSPAFPLNHHTMHVASTAGLSDLPVRVRCQSMAVSPSELSLVREGGQVSESNPERRLVIYQLLHHKLLLHTSQERDERGSVLGAESLCVMEGSSL